MNNYELIHTKKWLIIEVFSRKGVFLEYVGCSPLDSEVVYTKQQLRKMYGKNITFKIFRECHCPLTSIPSKRFSSS